MLTNLLLVIEGICKEFEVNLNSDIQKNFMYPIKEYLDFLMPNYSFCSIMDIEYILFDREGELSRINFFNENKIKLCSVLAEGDEDDDGNSVTNYCGLNLEK